MVNNRVSLEQLNDRQGRLLRTLVQAIDEEDYTHFIAMPAHDGWSFAVVGFRSGLPQKDFPDWKNEFGELDLQQLEEAGAIRLEKKYGRSGHYHYKGAVTRQGREAAAQGGTRTEETASLSLRTSAPTTTSPLLPEVLSAGDRVGPYKIEGMLGKGGMARVYRAIDTRLDDAVALKIMTPALDDAKRAARFRAEVRIARRIRHQNVCRIFDYDEVNGRPYYSMELVEGASLHDVLEREKRLSPERVVGIVEQVASVLDAMHAQGIIHRDLSDKNVMLTASDQVRLIDPGLAKDPAHEVSLTTAGAFVGTPAYASPERCSGKPATPSCDLYALGVLTYQLLVGEVPFSGDFLMVVGKHQHSEPNGDALPEAVRAAVLKCLMKSASDRHANPCTFSAELRAALAGANPNAQGPTSVTAGGYAPNGLAPAAPEPRAPQISTGVGAQLQHYAWETQTVDLSGIRLLGTERLDDAECDRIKQQMLALGWNVEFHQPPAEGERLLYRFDKSLTYKERLRKDNGRIAIAARRVSEPWRGVILTIEGKTHFFDWGERMVSVKEELAPFRMTKEFDRQLRERFYARSDAGLRDVGIAFASPGKARDWIYETDEDRSWKRKLQADFDEQYMHAAPWSRPPVQCEQCGKRYDAGAINCPDCGIPLPTNSQQPLDKSLAKLQGLSARLNVNNALDATAVSLCRTFAQHVRDEIYGLVQTGQLANGSGASVMNNRNGGVFAVSAGFREPLEGSAAMTYEVSYQGHEGDRPQRASMVFRMTIDGYAQVEIPRGHDSSNPGANFKLRWMVRAPEQGPAQTLSEIGVAAALSENPVDQAQINAGLANVAKMLVHDVVGQLAARVTERARELGFDIENL